MAWELTEDVEQFSEITGGFLHARPIQHTVLLTLVAKLRRHGPHAYGPDDPVFGWWRPAGGEIEGVLVQTPPHPMMFSEIPAEAVPAAVAAVAGRPLTAVNLTAGAAEVFADLWRRHTGGQTAVGRQSRLYRLDTLTPPPAPAGTARTATAADRDLLVRWLTEFHREIDEPAGHVRRQVDDFLSFGGIALWESGGEPVSMAGRTRIAAGMVRVLAVYTPPRWRRRGFAGAATVAATRAALADGAHDVVLFTDLANPTSNRLYQRLGYRPVEDRAVVEFA